MVKIHTQPNTQAKAYCFEAAKGRKNRFDQHLVNF
jgi:hypothetical protein